jgi:hypothetical protein
VATYHGVYNAKSNLKRWYNAVMTKGDLVIANSEYTRAHVIAEHGVAPEPGSWPFRAASTCRASSRAWSAPSASPPCARPGAWPPTSVA